jgi:SAM-dependent methyltransferase
MNEATWRALAGINDAFYRDHAEAFAATRTTPWQGWDRLLPLLRETAPPLRVLDVGCGHGRFARFLADALPGSPVAWTGVDGSAALLEQARRGAPGAAARVRGDVVADPEALPAGPVDWVVLFGVLHGGPSAERRRALLEACAGRLAPGGRLAFTTWRFAEDGRARGRILPRNAFSSRAPVPIDCSQLEPGDALLPFGPGDEVVRYVHAFDDSEIARWLRELPLARAKRFRADGRTGDQNEYFVLGRAD